MHNPQVLHIETINADWCDKDIVMLHACFQLLTDFVEKELNIENDKLEHDEETTNARKEIDELYNWWKGRLIKEAEGKLEPLYNNAAYDEDNQMLIRLIEIRKYLWT